MAYRRAAHLYDELYDWKDYDAEAERVREIILQRVPTAETLLDVACGTGRHLERFRSWFSVVGVDLEPSLLEVAERRLPGVPLHLADMRSFDLGSQFDVVTCLFSSIGHVRTVRGLRRAVASMAAHLKPRGVLIVEPWLAPTGFDAARIGRLIAVERPQLEVVRMNSSRVSGRLSIMDFHYLVAQPGQVEHLVERHTLGLFNKDEYREAFESAGLSVEHDDVGLMGRGLWIARAPAS